MKENSKYQFEKISHTNYNAIYLYAQNNVWGDNMLPIAYESNLWGLVVYEDNKLCGLWVGKLRGTQKPFRVLTKSVYFDTAPIVDNGCKEISEALIQEAKRIAHEEKIIMLHLNHWVRECVETDMVNTHPNATYIVDLSQTEDELFNKLEQMKQRNVKKAIKKGVEIEHYYQSDGLLYLQDFQHLRQQTQSRAIAKHSNASMLLKSNDFFKKLFASTKNTLFIAKYENKIVSVANIIQGGQTVYYHMGGSDLEVNRQTSASTLLFWEAMKYYKNKGIRYFDFGGSPLNPTEDDPAYGVYLFKKGFGGDLHVNTIGDIVINNFKYKLLNLILKQRNLLRIFSKREA